MGKPYKRERDEKRDAEDFIRRAREELMQALADDAQAGDFLGCSDTIDTDSA